MENRKIEEINEKQHYNDYDLDLKMFLKYLNGLEINSKDMKEKIKVI